MKILFICNQLCVAGGLERVLTNVANELSRNYNVSILEVNYTGIQNYILEEKINLLRTKSAKELTDVKEYYKRIPKENKKNDFIKELIPTYIYKKILSNKYKNKLIEIEEIIDKEKPDVIVDTSSIYSIFLSNSKKIISWEHTEYSLNGKLPNSYIKVRNNSYRKLKAVVCLTKQDEEKYKKNKIKAICIPNFLNELPVSFSSLDNKNAISIGRIENDKNFFDMIYIWKKVVEIFPESKLSIFGNGSEKENLENLILKMRLENNVFFKGITNDVYGELRENALFLLTSKHEGFSMVLLEAMACGLNVISYDCNSGPREIIDNNRNGFLIPNGDRNKFIEKIIELIKNDSLKQSIGENAKKINYKFSKAKIIDSWIKLLGSK